MDQFHGQPCIAHRHGDDSELHFPAEDAFQRAQPLGSHHAQHHPRVLPSKLREDLRQHVKMSRLIRADRQLAARRTLLLGNRQQFLIGNGAPQEEGEARHAILREGLEQPPRCGKRHLSAVAVEKARSHLLLQGANLRRNSRLCAE